jgi:hypothetical protein
MEIRMTTRRWPDASGPWKLVFRWAEVGGRFECVGLDMHAVGRQPDPLTTSTLRSVNLAALIDEQRPRLRRRKVSARSASLSPKPEDEQTRRGRPPTYGADHFVQVAQIYAEAWDRSENPTRAVAEWGDVSQSTAAKWVYRARHQFGLLGPTSRGTPGGVRLISVEDTATATDKRRVRKRKK